MKTKSKYYLISVTGFECYEPRYFRCDCSKDEFKKAVAESMDEAIPSLMKRDGWITGHELLDKLVPIMVKKGFWYAKPDFEVDIKGECIYAKREDNSEINDRERPEFISDESWNKIIEHNEKFREKLNKQI